MGGGLDSIEVPRFHDVVRGLPAVLILYIYLFQPPVIDKLFFIGSEFIIFVSIFSLKSKPILKILNVFKVEFFILMLIVGFSLVRDFFSGSIVYSDRFLAWGFQSFIFGSVVLYFYENKRGSLFSALYWASFLASLLTISLLFFPDFDKFYESIQIDSYYERYKNFEVRYRAYGISENLTFTYAFVMGLFSGYSFLLLKKNILFIIPFVTFLLGAIFNARIGLVPVIFLIFYSIFVRFDVRNLSRLLVAILFFFFIGVIYFSIFGGGFENAIVFSNINWVMMFFYDVVGLSGGESTISTLFGRFIIWPDESVSQFLFGRGESLFNKERGMNSDIGFILQINYGGFLFLILILVFMGWCSYRLFKVLGPLHWFSGFFVALLIVLNTKGFVFAATPGGRLMFLLYMYFILNGLRVKYSYLSSLDKFK